MAEISRKWKDVGFRKQIWLKRSIYRYLSKWRFSKWSKKNLYNHTITLVLDRNKNIENCISCSVWYRRWRQSTNQRKLVHEIYSIDRVGGIFQKPKSSVWWNIYFRRSAVNFYRVDIDWIYRSVLSNLANEWCLIDDSMRWIKDPIRVLSDVNRLHVSFSFRRKVPSA